MRRNRSANGTSNSLMDEDQVKLRQAYKRGGIGLAIAALVWFVAYLVARAQQWEEQSLLIPLAAAGLSALCFSLYFRSKEEG